MKTKGQNGLVAIAFVLGLLVCGCRHTTTKYSNLPGASPAGAALNPVALPNQRDPAWLKPPADLFTLGPGDRVEVEILGEPASRTTTIIAPDGKIYFNLLPGIDVWGATLGQAKALLEKELSNYVKEKPQVSVVLRGVESKRVWVLGRVQAPGVYAMTTPMTVLEAVSMAGGTLALSNYRDQEVAGFSEELADLPRSFVIRHGKLLPVDFQKLI